MGLLTDTKGRKQLTYVVSKYCSKICILSYLVGIIWFCALSDSSVNNRTYFSENALLPGQVQSEYQNEQMAYSLLAELENLSKKQKKIMLVDWLSNKMSSIGLQTYQQNFTVHIPLPESKGQSLIQGTNIYGVLRAPRIASTEALVFSLPYDKGTNMAGIALMLSLAEHFRSKSYWSKDIIFLATDEGLLGMHAWLEAYHDIPNPYIKSLPLEGHSGSIQAAINLEMSTSHVDLFEILEEGINGQLPNLDLINMVSRLCMKDGIDSKLHTQAPHSPNVEYGSDELVSMVKMLLNQASGLPTSTHGLFHRYRIEAVTLFGKALGSRGRRGFDSSGSVIEGIFRSLNNLMERFHQSFFFYLLPAPYRYVSIGLYMPPFCCLLLGPLITAVKLWVITGDPSILHGPKDSEKKKKDKETKNENKKDDEKKEETKSKSGEKEKKGETHGKIETVKKEGGEEKADKAGKTDEKKIIIDEVALREKVGFAWSPQQVSGVFPIVMVTYVAGALLYYSPHLGYELGIAMEMDGLVCSLLSVCCVMVTMVLTPLLQRILCKPSSMSNLYLVKCVALVLFSVTMASLGALNFSLAFLVCVITVPAYLITGPTQNTLRRFFQSLMLLVASPPAMLLMHCLIYNVLFSESYQLSAENMDDILMETINMSYRAILSGLRDSYILGTWSFGIVCIGLIPNWTLFWYLAWQK